MKAIIINKDKILFCEEEECKKIPEESHREMNEFVNKLISDGKYNTYSAPSLEVEKEIQNKEEELFKKYPGEEYTKYRITFENWVEKVVSSKEYNVTMK